MRLETARLVLRPPTLDDVAAAAGLAGDPEVMRFIGGTLPAEQFIAQWIGWWQTDGAGPFLVERRADGCFLGRVGVHTWDTRTWSLTTHADAGAFAQPELGWVLVRDAWGNGYATEAARAVRDWHGVDGLVSVIAAENAASQGVARRLGGSPGETVLLFETRPAVVWRYSE